MTKETEKSVPQENSSTEGNKIAWGGELMSSVVVFLVALPLCMGIAIASGVPASLGIISGIIGGLVVGSLAGAPLQVSGPAAGLAVIVFELVQKHGLKTLGVIVLLAGLLQVLAGIFRFGRWFRAVSPAVVHGMLAGIGVLIFAAQFHVMVDDKPVGSGIKNLISIPQAIYKGIFPIGTSQHHLAAYIGLLTIVTLVAWNLLKPKKLKFLPAPLLAILVAVIASSAFAMKINYVNVPTNLLDSTNIPKDLGFFAKLAQPSIILAAVAMALVASAESLLCATATDQLHDGARANYDRELFAQGVGNMVAGFLGALPITGVIVRSSANIESGAKTRFSAIIHGIWLLAFIVAFPVVIRMIPRSALAAILVYIGFKLVNKEVIKNLWTTSRSEFIIYLSTVICIVSIDLLSGVMIGVALSVGKLLFKFSHLKIDVESDAETNRHDVYVEGAATFIRLPKLAEALESLPRDGEIHLHAGLMYYIDHACIELIGNIHEQAEKAGGSFVVEWDALRGKFKGVPQVVVSHEDLPPSQSQVTLPQPKTEAS